MKPTICIDGRDLVPVRLIPYMTGWKFAPDEVARILANRDGFHRMFISSYHLLPNATYGGMLPKEWDVILADLEILVKILEAEEKVEGEGYPIWRERAVKVLPPATFVWLDELQSAWDTAYSKERMTIPGERPGDRKLNLKPRVPPKMAPLVYEGFDAFEGVKELLPASIETSSATAEQSQDSAKAKSYKPSTVRREAGKLKTQDRYKSWQAEYTKLKRKKPGMGKKWYSEQIAKLPIAQGRDTDTIRKHLKD